MRVVRVHESSLLSSNHIAGKKLEDARHEADPRLVEPRSSSHSDVADLDPRSHPVGRHCIIGSRGACLHEAQDEDGDTSTL
jgi:hypothetical protein